MASRGTYRPPKDLKTKTVCGEKADMDRAACEDWLSRELKDRLASYSLDDMFNADETAIYYKLLSNKTITFQGDDCAGGKRSKERLTVMILATTWNSIKPDTIASYFRKCGFGESAAGGEMEEAEPISSDNDCLPDSVGGVFLDGITFESYVEVDTGVETYGIITDAEIIQAMCLQQARSEDPSALSGEHSDANKEMPPPSATDVARDLRLCGLSMSVSDKGRALIGWRSRVWE
ncbi:hypothetical protein HPB47_025904 [Ixodes persulcatus]|uniref:Uncharacterized protein n=1 Tax=Ixodes persulcatus TaxID=34615 RepID=A0AC60Q0E8_IXOPE|nr:hypothetical protein HPB47_025904 [Ixodes persulcatus]